MRTKGTPAELEARRRRAAVSLGQGKGTNEVARLIGVAPSSVSRWKAALRRRGSDGLRAKPHPGPALRLDRIQKRQLVALLKKGAVAAGHDSELWTCRLVADLIGRHLGVWYDPDHVGRLLHLLGFSVQKPEARACERDEKAIASWRRRDWPRIKATRGA